VVTRVKPRYLKNNTSPTKKVFIESLGCSKNLVKSESIASLLNANGYSFLSASENPVDASLVIINTCGFIKSARKEAEDRIDQFESMWKAGKRILVVGCYASRFSKFLKKKYPNCTIVENQNPILGIQDALQIKSVNPCQRLLSTRFYAYEEIAEGCSKSCSYCLIPSIKGPYRSKSRESIITEIKSLCEQRNVREIVLIAQDTASYGSDFTSKDTLLSLVQSISAIKDLDWIRIMYLYPILSLNTLHQILSVEKVVPYLDMPLQHFSKKVLTLMNRPSNLEPYLEELFTYKIKHPSLTLRSTFMVGFPGESEEDFSLLAKGLTNYPFDRAGFFSYSREQDTTAATFAVQVHPSTKKRRLQEVYRIQEKISKMENQKFIGKEMNVLLENFDPNTRKAFGRTYREAPEVDPSVIISGNPIRLKNKVGSIQTLKIASAEAYEIQGTLKE
jgi:ribosomal protein S12 methylthiotransferase